MVVVAGHCRFATSSDPTEAESHPHQWTPSKAATLWQPTDSTATQQLPSTLLSATRPYSGMSPSEVPADTHVMPEKKATQQTGLRQRCRLQPVSALHGVFVTHNGDFEAYDLFGEKKACAEVMSWLAAVLQRPAPACCDSVAIAGKTGIAYGTCPLGRHVGVTTLCPNALQ